MKEFDVSILINLCHELIGVNLKSSHNSGEPRAGFVFWFDNYNRGNGPVFSLRPTGLKRHLVTVSFGPYAKAVIDHIKEHADNYSYTYCDGMLDTIIATQNIKRTLGVKEFKQNIGSEFKLEIEVEVDDQFSLSDIQQTARTILIPLVACLAELIGYTEIDTDSDFQGVEEGSRYYVALSRYERNPRNRYLCLAIHGNTCKICGFDPTTVYGTDFSSIIEVHHIEPLSESKTPRLYDPKTDLIPVCPNCHRAIHKRVPAYTPHELRSRLID